MTIYPAMPPTRCTRAPAAPDVDASDNDWVRYKRARDAAGDECRDKLDAVDAFVNTWPHQAIDQVPK